MFSPYSPFGLLHENQDRKECRPRPEPKSSNITTSPVIFPPCHYTISLDVVPEDILRNLLNFISSPADTCTLLAVSKQLHTQLIAALLHDPHFTLDATGACLIRVDYRSPLVHWRAGHILPLATLMLAQASARPRINSLTLDIGPEPQAWGSMVARQVRLLAHVLERTGVQRATLIIPSKPVACEPHYMARLAWENPERVARLPDTLNELLAAAAALPTLETLRIQAPPKEDLFASISLDKVIRDLNRVPFEDRDIVNLRHKSLPVIIAPTSVPMTLYLHSPTLIVPTVGARTMALLRSRPLAALHVRFTNLTIANWADILVDIRKAQPTLTTLVLLGIPAGPRILRRLGLFPHLNTLTIDTLSEKMTSESTRGLLGFKLGPSKQPPVFPQLTALTVSPTHLRMLLEVSASLPALSTITIRLRVAQFLHIDTLHILSDMSSRLQGSFGTGGSPLMLVLEVVCKPNSQRPMCNSMDVCLNNETLWDGAFSRFEELRITGLMGDDSPTLARWVTLFPTARRVVFFGTLPQEAHRGRISSVILREAQQIDKVLYEEAPVSEEVSLQPKAGLGAESSDPRSRIQFTDLPDDVLLTIFSWMQADLYAMSHLSRRLNMLALPLFLAAHNIINPQEDIKLEIDNPRGGADILSALSSAIFIKEIKNITCVFSNCQTISWFIHDITRLIAFLTRFPSIEAFSVTLFDLYRLPSDIVDHITWARCREAVAGLISAVLSKNCQSLAIYGPVFVLQEPDSLAWPLHAQRLPLSLQAMAGAGALQKLTISHQSLVALEGLRWIASALRYAPNITTLAITIPEQPLAAKQLIELARGFFANVTELILMSGTAHFSTWLVYHLGRAFPRLQRVVFPHAHPHSTDYLSGCFSSELLIPLSNLTQLTASPAVVLELLGMYPGKSPAQTAGQPQPRPNLLPRLQTLTLLLSQSIHVRVLDGWTAMRALKALCPAQRQSAAAPQLRIVLHILYSRVTNLLDWWHQTSGFPAGSADEVVPAQIDTLMLTHCGTEAAEISAADHARAVLRIGAQFPALRVLEMFWAGAAPEWPQEDGPLDWGKLGRKLRQASPQFDRILLDGRVVYSYSDS